MARFENPSVELLKHISDFVSHKRPNMLFAGVSISEESAQAGYVLSKLHLPHATEYLTCFSNSLEEAISGSIKLARHTARTKRRSGQVVIIDEAQYIERYFNPLGSGPSESLIPGLTFVRSVAAALAFLNENTSPPAAVVYVHSREGHDRRTLGELIDLCNARGVMAVACDNRSIAESIVDRHFDLSRYRFVVYVYGENITGFQYPMGAFVMSPSAFRVWNHPINALAHSSTFGANALGVSFVVQTLQRNGLIEPVDVSVMDQIACSRSFRNKMFQTYINPQAAIWLQAYRLDMDIQTASGAAMVLGNGARVIDMAAGTGANMHGHNPPRLESIEKWYDEDYAKPSLKNISFRITRNARPKPSTGLR